jgi:hypothetical protein
MREAAMQLHLAFLDLTDPRSPTPTSPPPTPWEQIDEAGRTAALELLARVIAGTLAAQETRETPND